MAEMQGRVLIIAGSDSGGGAGIQADLKTVTALGGFAMTAITALTAQNTKGVFGVHETPLAFIEQQIDVVADDLGVDCVKTGMLATTAVIEAVAARIDAKMPSAAVVVDPVMVAKGGHPLLAGEAVTAMQRVMIPRATVLTPNAPEAESLTGKPVKTVDDLINVGEQLMALGAQSVFMKGGHLVGPKVTDVLVMPDGYHVYESKRIDTPHTHGTGCTTASAIATGLAQGLSIENAVVRARAFVLAAIASAPGYGGGHGPLNHAHTVTTAR
jgi:hydroxymethylpyrimidine/phosphomethylpyrimidine kinase